MLSLITLQHTILSFKVKFPVKKWCNLIIIQWLLTLSSVPLSSPIGMSHSGSHSSLVRRACGTLWISLPDICLNPRGVKAQLDRDPGRRQRLQIPDET